tara:strand:- start:53 stop:430 length:378 start_codon:yes stop_codon:yes gene_type:complete
MAEIYTNLPPKNQDDFDKTITKLTTSTYEDAYQFAPGEYDAAIAFFVKRGFDRTAAESTAYVILAQAKIDNIKSQEVLDKLSGITDAQLSEIITIILNANRYKSSKLGVRQTLNTKDTVSRNILD